MMCKAHTIYTLTMSIYKYSIEEMVVMFLDLFKFIGLKIPSALHLCAYMCFLYDVWWIQRQGIFLCVCCTVYLRLHITYVMYKCVSKYKSIISVLVIFLTKCLMFSDGKKGETQYCLNIRLCLGLNRVVIFLLYLIFKEW